MSTFNNMGKSTGLTRAVQVDAFILSSIKEGKFSREDIENAIVRMALVKSHKEAKRRVTRLENRLKAAEAGLLNESQV